MRHYTSEVVMKKGLRPIENIKTEDIYLTQAQGLISEDGALHTIDTPTVLTTPDPVLQIVQLKNRAIVITTTSFYELVNSTLTLKLSIASTGRWGIADYGEFILFVDPTRTVSRDPFTGVYTTRTDIPKGFDAINYGGQCLIAGAINV